MATIVIVSEKVNFREVFAALARVNLQSAVSHPDIGTMLVIDPSQEDEAIDLLQSRFGREVTVYDAKLHVPTDWGEPGFVNETLQNEANVLFVMTSGLGLLVR